jgi:formiminotetrahydrofolate cyclodeaminase
MMRPTIYALGSLAEIANVADIPSGTAKGLLETFLDKGILGALVVIRGIVVIRMYRDLSALQAERLKDEQERNDAVNAARIQTAELASEMRTASQRVAEVCNRIADEARERRIREEEREKHARDEALADAKRTGARNPVR